MSPAGRMTVAEFNAIKQPKRQKYNAKATYIDGHRFASRAEAEYYLLLKADPEVCYIGIHPIVTLPGGVRYRPDFEVWRRCNPSVEPTGEVVEIKGVITADFRIKRKLFDQYHPLAPLKVLRKTRKGWEAI